VTLEVGADLEIRALEQAPSVVVNSVTSLPAGNSPTVVNSGTAQNALLDFGIPAGAAGATGATGSAGANGANATNPNFTIGTVTTLSPGASATVSFSGSYPNLALNLGIPQGATGSGTTFAWGAATGTLTDQTDLATALNAKAPLASPALTGNPTAPTPTAGDNDTSIATTAFVVGAIASVAPLASPALTGNPTAPTATAGDNDNSIATTAFVHNELGGYAPLAGAALTGNPTADGFLVGYRNLPTSRTVAANITLADTDKGKKILISGTRTITLNPNATTAIDVDALGTIVNTGTNIITIARGTGVTAKLMGTGADANRSIAAGGVATWLKVGTDAYFFGGPGVS
jgi:hypothetical protein